MDAATRELFEAAVAARRRAYSPYSGYAVGAAIRTPSGRVFTGCNVENASYPEGTCAETGAIAAMVAAGERTIVAIVVVTDGTTPGTPCGGCRQRIREFARPDTRIHSMTSTGESLTSTMSAILPDSFGPERLGRGTV
jgi:cytidine deaminase